MAAIIKHVEKKDGLTLRGRDVFFELQNKNLDPALVSVIARMAEGQFTLSKGVAEIAQMQDKLVDIIAGMTTVAENLKKEAERLGRSHGEQNPETATSSFPNQERNLETGG